MPMHLRRSTLALLLALGCAGDDGPSTTGAATGASSETGDSSTSASGSGDASTSSGDASSGGDASTSGESSSGEGSGSDGSGGSDEGSTTGAPAQPYADCDDAMSCGDALVCVEDPIPGEVGLQYCAPPCDPDGDGSECPPAPPDTEVTPTCVDRHDGTGVCGLDCLGGYTCPQGMSCFDGWLCVWEP